ncbi:ElaA protein [Alloactinosynnema sp. L-07]|uniref:GNAT family N-acetyltransferase n=1 Tax=Alloactinosynnema sp. L-07 TaxID=1653480 RepID=UPI00065F03C1|nr:GNAT family N-acetyltransferase [Alloactinosynnema sp. L-07]CRK58573.1 ElaA protein [Alloactinosynnema sp. L-07]
MTLHRAAGPDLSTAELYALLRLRVAIFIIEQDCPYPELDGLDLLVDTVHFWWQPADAPAPLACLRVLAGEPPKIGRVCTAVEARGQGLGAKLMTAAVEYLGDVESELHAQVQAQGLYARFGYVPVGEPYDDDGIQHITMRRPAVSEARGR